MGNASEEVGKVVNPRRLGLDKLAPEAGAFQRSDIGKGMEALTSGAAEGISHGIGQISDTLNRSDLNVANWGPGKQEQKAQSAVGKYSSGRGESSTSSRRGASIEDKAKKKVKGKARLYARK